MTRTGPITYAELAQIPTTKLSGVGPKKAEKLASAELHNLFDLLTHYPRRYLDRTRQAEISELDSGTEATVLVEVVRTQSRRSRGGKTMVTTDARDDSGFISLTFFNQAWRARQLTAGMTALVHGKADTYRGNLQMVNPVVDLVGNRTGRIIPVYPQSQKAGLTTWELSDHIAEILRRSAKRGLADPVPPEIIDRLGLMSRATAVQMIHSPGDFAQITKARDRLVFDELLRVQLALVARKATLARSGIGRATKGDGQLLERLFDNLGFEPTDAQRRALDEIVSDMETVVPMHRLLQGDVGSGKTLVALGAMLTAIEAGHQAALMAPTEVLAEQHFATLRELLNGMTVADSATLMGERPVNAKLLTNKTTPSERRKMTTALIGGEIDLIVGTHALTSDDIVFNSLALAVVDEQHRFGVEQRAALRDKNPDHLQPDLLVMTATPIPRSAAMTVYGDLDTSVLDELPAGRTPVITRRIDEAGEPQMWQEVSERIADGGQAYVVCPLIEDSERVEAKSAEEVYGRLTNNELAGLRVGLLHGRMASVDKDAVMALFRRGDLDVLVATTIIEVGVDVPNATTMVILDAGRFGIAQLHQLRGRVGRGSVESMCFLCAQDVTEDADVRLDALVDSTDGFELAEIDLDLRGEGTLMGQRQKGRNDLKLASLRRDRDHVETARLIAFDLIGENPVEFVLNHRRLAEEVEFFLGAEEADNLLKG